ncbi:NACHT domain-containing protein [Actinoplanes sp. CA-015351]|uniref:NACHT domain-containing protein n=1 Tax=Actinoplanes sp. CA-015351 TaxID=3239897 RepID=UPI003D99462E
MARSRLSYPDAVKLLIGGDDPITLLGRAAGGAMLLAAPFAQGLLGWFDYKGEANNVLRELLGRAPARIRSTRGRRHYELIEAAHTVLVVSSFFDALQKHIGDRFKTLELTDEERTRVLNGAPLGTHSAVSMPDALTGFDENLPAVERALSSMHAAFRDFAEGLAAAQGMTMPAAELVVGVALSLYRERYVRLGVDVPEFGIWSQLAEHAATRAEVRRQTETLTGLAERLARIVDGAAPAAVEGLALQYADVLRRPLWRSDAPAPDGLSFPTVERGFISPAFRLAVCDKEAHLSDENWWRKQKTRDDLETFLAGYFTAPDSTQRPLVILGHPGAGKSLLTEVVAARVPAEAFTTIRVPLRRVDPDAAVHQQIEAAVEKVTKERISWGDLCRAADTTKVILLDGFDELVQATGVTQSHYVEAAATFQQEEWVQGRPVVVVITSRTLVMDRTVVREGTVVIKLEAFDEDQVGRWADAWNAVNHDQAGFRPLTRSELWRHQELASQPLLLLMLAVYAAEAGELGADDLSTDQLYRRLLDSFIRRQVREKSTERLAEAAFAKSEGDSRRDLAAVAFAMFNRKRQWVTEEDLGLDLKALHPDSPTQQEVVAGEPVSRARRTVAAFFFVHVAQTGDEARTAGRRSYEFLHATFAEYLVAEHTLELIKDLAVDWQLAQRRAYKVDLSDRVLRAFLSHQPLTNGEQVVPFLLRMIEGLVEDEQAAVSEVALELFRSARRRIQDDEYRPTPFDVVNRTAAYTANLILLAVLARGGEGVAIEEFSGTPDTPALDSTVRLWRSGLDAEAQEGLFAVIDRTDSRYLVASRGSRPPEVSEARLAGENYFEAVLHAGMSTLWTGDGSLAKPMTDVQRIFHQHVSETAMYRWSSVIVGSPVSYLTGQYEQIRELAGSDPDAASTAESRFLLAMCLLQDSEGLPPTLVSEVVRAALLVTDHVGLSAMTAALALHRPHLIRENSALVEIIEQSGDFLLLFERARRSRDKDPEVLDPIIDTLRAKVVRQVAEHTVMLSGAVPSMIAGFQDQPAVVAEILSKCRREAGPHWADLRPAEFLAAIDVPAFDLPRYSSYLDGYVTWYREGVLDGEDAVAFARLQDLLAGLRTPDEG